MSCLEKQYNRLEIFENIWVQPALAADDARGGDEEDRGGENEQDAKAGEDSDHLFYKVELDKLVGGTG